MANGCTEDVPVEVVGDPQLLTWLSLAGVVVEDAVDELGHVSLAHEGYTASTPASACKAGTKCTMLSAEVDQLIEKRTGAVIEILAALMTFIHQLAELGDLGFLIEVSALAGGLEVVDTLAFSIDMHSTLIEEELRVLLLDSVDVGDVVDHLEGVVSVAGLLDLSWCITTWFQLFADELKHTFPGLIESDLELLHGVDDAIPIALVDAGSQGE